MVNYNEAQLDLAFGALAHPIRRGIMARLATGEATVAELAGPHNVSAPAISKHLRILEKAGLMARKKEGRVHHCRMDAEKMKKAERWIEHYRKFWEASLDRLDEYLKTMQAKEKKHDPHKK